MLLCLLCVDDRTWKELRRTSIIVFIGFSPSLDAQARKMSPKHSRFMIRLLMLLKIIMNIGDMKGEDENVCEINRADEYHDKYHMLDSQK